MKYLRVAISIQLFFISALSCAQNETDRPDFLPPSPEASSLGKFGQHTVDLNTGIPSISIPIYTIQLRDFSFPVSISYNASGIKVNEIASRVGLGWALNAGGVVSVNTVGLSDTSTPVFTPQTNPPFAPAYHPVNGPNVDYGLAQDILNNGTYNTEPDTYVYNFMGYSGKYVSGINGILMLPFNKDIIFEQGYAVDKTGNKFYFEQSELQSTTRTCLVGGASSPFVSTVTANYLSKILTTSGDIILLEYENETYSYYQSTSETKHFRDPSEDMQCALPENDFEKCKIKSNVTLPRLRKVKASNGVVIDFFYETFLREDIETVSNIYMLKRVRVTNGAFIEYNFDYEEIKNYVSPSGLSEEQIANKTRIYLKKLTMSDGGVYEFAYNNPAGLPDRDSYRVDYWGYFNNAGNSTLLPSYSYLSFSGANRAPNETYAGLGTIQKITYPTKGYTTFEFEGHKSDGGQYFSGGLRVKSISDYYADNVLAEKKVYSYPGNSSGYSDQPFVSKYFFDSYQKRKDIEGQPSATIRCQFHVLSSTSTPVLGGYDFNTSYKYGVVEVNHENIQLSGKSRYTFQQVQFNFSGLETFIDGIDEVKPITEEHYKYDAGNHVLIQKKEYKYKVFNDTGSQYTTVPNQINYDQVLGFRIKQVLPEQYTGTGTVQAFLPAEFSWHYYRYASFWYYLDSLKETNYNGAEKLTTYQKFKYENYLHAQPTSTITHNSKGEELVQVTRYPQDYSINNVIENVTTPYYFNYRGLPVAKLSFTNGKLVSGVVNKWQKSGNLIQLHEKYLTRLSTPLNDTNNYPSYGLNPISQFLTGAPFHLFYEIISSDNYNNPNEIKYAERKEVQSLIWDSKGHRVQAIVDNAKYDSIAFTNFETSSKGSWTYTHTYDSGINNFYTGSRSFKGASLTRDNLLLNKSYKVSVWAKNQVPTISGKTPVVTAGRNDWSLYEWIITGLDSVTINSNNAFLDDARLHPINSRMISFSYDPLFGVKSKTDINNITQYFEYDGSGRLILIKDDNGHILKTFEYHYLTGALSGQ